MLLMGAGGNGCTVEVVTGFIFVRSDGKFLDGCKCIAAVV